MFIRSKKITGTDADTETATGELRRHTRIKTIKLAWEKRKHIKVRFRCVVSFSVFSQANLFWFRFLLTVNKYYQCLNDFFILHN